VTLTSPAQASTDTIKERRLTALRKDLQIAHHECGPRFLTPHPTYGERFFVVAADSTILDKDMCAKHGEVHRSLLRETVTEKEMNELIRELGNEGYNIRLHEKGGSSVDGYWIKFKTIYYAGDRK
jgi:hypothetical protein